MKTLVVYDSVYGNTEHVAQAIGAALGAKEDVTVMRVSQVEPEQLTGMKLLIVGSPTQRFRPLETTTRLLKSIPHNGLKGVKVAAYDTRLTKKQIEKVRILAFFVRIFGYAAKPISDGLKKKGGELVVPPEGFFVNSTKGPLIEGELERAAEWAKKILATQ